MDNNKPKQPSKPPKKEEQFTRRELEELMGMHKDVLYKKNGAWRRR